MKIRICLAAFALTASTTNAFTIDSNIYFAYVQTSNRIMGLSKHPCKDKEAAKHNWMRAFYYFPQQEYYGIRDACWKKGKTETIYGTSDFSVCMLTDDGKLTGSCEPAQFGAMKKTQDLPKRLSASDF
jgi:hypothetical protein